MRKNIFRGTKIVVSVLLVFAIYRYFVKVENLSDVWNEISKFSFHLFVLSMIVSIVNWGIEARKWQVLVSNLQYINYPKAFKSVCAGAAVSNILPFRIGEYLGRIIYIKGENKIPAVFNSILGSTSQLLISLLFGIPASLYILDKEYTSIAVYAGIAVLLIPAAFIGCFYYFIRTPVLPFKWMNNLATDIRRFTSRQIFLVLWLSLLRYLLFASFYVFLLFCFDVVSSVSYGAAGVATIYLLQSFAPSIVLTDAGLRTGLPLLVFNPASDLQAPLLAAAIINYFFNLVMPSITGLVFIIARKVKNW